LRQKEVASELGVSVSAITDSLAACRGINFTQLLAEYRVRHAQQLLSGQPDIKLVAVFRESGFTSESTFFRTFKAVIDLPFYHELENWSNCSSFWVAYGEKSFKSLQIKQISMVKKYKDL